MKPFGKPDSVQKDLMKNPKYEEELRNAYNEAVNAQITAILKNSGFYQTQFFIFNKTLIDIFN